jgi:hypothetical protein
MNKQTFWESEVYTLREQIQIIETERNNLVRENEALKQDKKRLDVLSEETRDMYCFLRHSDYAAGIRIYAYFTNVSGRNFPNHMTLREATDAIIADRVAAKKESGDDAIMRQHLTEGGTPT